MNIEDKGSIYTIFALGEINPSVREMISDFLQNTFGEDDISHDGFLDFLTNEVVNDEVENSINEAVQDVFERLFTCAVEEFKERNNG